MRSMKRNLILVLSSVLLLLIWQLASMIIASPVLLPSLAPVFSSLISLIGQPSFAPNVLHTVLRALQSFLIIVASATVVGLVSGRFPLFSLALKPFVTTLKAIPVMSVILLAFIWFSSGTVPLFSAFLMGFPVMYVQVEMGYKRLDTHLQEMCRLYDFPVSARLTHFIIPSLLPSIVTGARTALSMVWKVVIASEVLTVPHYGVGSRMQLAQVQLETEKVLSWTLIAILLTGLGDLLFEGCVLLAVRCKRCLDARRVPCDL